MEVVAYKYFKGKRHKQTFSRFAWDAMGPNKNGWQEETDQVIDNDQKQAATKQTGPGKDQVIDNDLTKKTEPAKDPKENATSEPGSDVNYSKFNDEKVSEFMKHVEGYTKGSIKDHFDSLIPPVKYDNTANLQTLKKQLGDQYKYDVEKLQTAFVK